MAGGRGRQSDVQVWRLHAFKIFGYRLLAIVDKSLDWHHRIEKCLHYTDDVELTANVLFATEAAETSQKPKGRNRGRRGRRGRHVGR